MRKLNDPIRRLRDKETFKIFSLKPISDYENYKENVKMLNDAFDKEQTNIALTGPYGSGKSSVIRTFIDHQRKFRRWPCKKKFLSLSLAAFAENAKGIDDVQIEKCLLQQLFYKVKPSTIRFSRFNKITHTSLWKILLFIILSLFAAISIIVLINPLVVAEVIEKIDVLSQYCSSLLVKALLLLSACLIISILTLTIRGVISRFRISKFGYKNAEISAEHNEKTILNKYLDEILYFFEVTKYDSIVIEDLDRIVESEKKTISIFVKLRELNYLINNSDKVKKAIFFIYAVSDNLFKAKERTKFFDIIIPVIPIVNEANANDFLKQRLEEMGLLGENDISEKLVNELAPHFSEPRILLSAINEYIFYKSKIQFESMRGDQLFALMLYKNMYSEDFSALNDNSGFLFNSFALKRKAIRERVSQNNLKIKENEKEIDALETEYISNEDQLVGAFIHMFRKQKYYRIDIDNRSHDLDTLFNIDLVGIPSARRISLLHRNNGSLHKNYTYSEFDTAFSFHDLFYSKLQVLDEGKQDRIQRLKNEIDEMEARSKNIMEYSLEEYIKEFHVDGLDDICEPQNKPVLFMLKEGYIKEDYVDYITNFYGESLTSADMDFIMNVHYDVSPSYDYNLSQIGEIANRLEEKYFNRCSILNYDLVDYLTTQFAGNKKTIRLFKYLATYDEQSLDFIEKYILRNIKQEDFIRKLAKTSLRLWTELYYNARNRKEKTDDLLVVMLKALDIRTIIGINSYALEDTRPETKTITDYLSDSSNGIELLSILDNESAQSIISELDVFFMCINPDDVSLTLFKFVVEHGHYAINVHMVEMILRYITSVENVEVSYSSIQESMDEVLIQKVDQEIETYLSDVYFKTLDSCDENAEYVRKLLAIKDLNDHDAEQFLDIAQFVFEDLEGLDKKHWNALLSRSKVNFSWETVYRYLSEFSITDTLVNFISSGIRSIALPCNSDDYKKLIMSALISSKISKELFKQMIIDDFTVEDFNFKDADNAKLLILIANGMIELSVPVYNHFEVNYSMIVRLPLIVSKIRFFINFVENGEINPEDTLINQLLSSNIEDNEKVRLVRYIEQSDSFVVDEGIATNIVKAIDGKEIALQTVFFNTLFDTLTVNYYRIKLLVNRFGVISKDNIGGHIRRLDGEIAQILELHSKKTIELNDDNRSLVQYLKENDLISSYRINEDLATIRVNAFRK